MEAAPVEVVDEVVIAGGPDQRHRSRAGLQRLPNGELFAAFRVGWDMYASPHGAIVGTRSRDGGHTWDAPLPVVAEPGWDWFGAQRMLQLADGSLVMLPGKARWNTELFFAFSTRSRDGGRTWEEMGPDIRVFGHGSEPSGRGITEGPADNRLMLGFHGADERDGPAVAGVAFSADEGRTWSDRVVVAGEPGKHFREPALTRLGDGRILTVIRTDEPPCESYQSWSADEGKTWTPVAPTGFKGHCPCLVPLRGGIVCAYRDMEPGRPGIGYSVTCDDGQSWHYGGPLYESAAAYSGWASACGYPSAVRLSDDEVFCAFHTDFVDGDSQIRGLFLRDRT